MNRLNIRNFKFLPVLLLCILVATIYTSGAQAAVPTNLQGVQLANHDDYYGHHHHHGYWHHGYYRTGYHHRGRCYIECRRGWDGIKRCAKFCHRYY